MRLATRRSELHTSKLLQDFLRQHDGETIRLGELIRGLGKRSFGPTLLICALPEALPLPIAGVSAFIGMPLVLVSLQLMLGYTTPWFPKWIANRSIKRKDFEKGVNIVLRYLARFEKIIRPRWKLITTPIAERLLSILFFLLACVIVLPIPFGNFLPAIALVIISLGLIEGDGLVIVVGIITACLVLAVMAGAIVAFFSWSMTVIKL
ncbi:MULTISPECIES: exopolysaccharide biosynthesis protein [Leptolyngbya]|uniref:exopolysaccharide biosynthesis protein n=1 Tax=Leptolyngbya TaxID=47251 RepID=UPI0016833013|nr:exopolysaccharide biosynthesis protein [Leptolyngbya sp. FACHB-1624]MBD1854213.1 exopolysaccharide biosynthesis protein [Leptolyngbya sp. FACHB-1624]